MARRAMTGGQIQSGSERAGLVAARQTEESCSGLGNGLLDASFCSGATHRLFVPRNEYVAESDLAEFPSRLFFDGAAHALQHVMNAAVVRPLRKRVVDRKQEHFSVPDGVVDIQKRNRVRAFRQPDAAAATARRIEETRLDQL